MNSIGQILHTVSYMALPLLLAMVFHEYAHGWVASRHGDPTARLNGRLTLDPRAHIDPFGTILLPLLCLIFPTGILLGYAKPVPINPGNLRNPRRDMALVAAAGPGMNLLLAIVSALALSAILAADPTVADSISARGPGIRRDLGGMLLVPLAWMCTYSVLINVVLMVFNLIPIPPLDGSKVLFALVDRRTEYQIRPFLEQYGGILLILLIFSSFILPGQSILGRILGPIVDGIYGVLVGT
jgi:Zn-dependent protease